MPKEEKIIGRINQDLELKEGEVGIILKPYESNGFAIDIIDRTEKQVDKTLIILATGMTHFVLQNTVVAYSMGHTLAADKFNTNVGQLLIKRLVSGVDIRTAEEATGNA